MESISSESKENLLKAWTAWDKMPGDEYRANAMEEACKEIALKLGLTTTHFRIKLTALRVQGIDREECMEKAISGD